MYSARVSQRKYISERGNIFYKSRSKELAQKKHFLFCSEYVKIYCITRIFFYKKPSKGPSSISFLFQVQILVLKVS